MFVQQILWSNYIVNDVRFELVASSLSSVRKVVKGWSRRKREDVSSQNTVPRRSLCPHFAGCVHGPFGLHVERMKKKSRRSRHAGRSALRALFAPCPPDSCPLALKESSLPPNKLDAVLSGCVTQKVSTLQSDKGYAAPIRMEPGPSSPRHRCDYD